MLKQLEQEEAKLRRKLLFRILRGFNFDAPNFRSEAISDVLPHNLACHESEGFRVRHFQRGSQHSGSSIA